MNKQYEKLVQRREKTYLMKMDITMVITTKGQETMSLRYYLVG